MTDAITRQDKLLALHGWKVFRIPIKVATTFEEDLLPTHLKDAYLPTIEDWPITQIIDERQDWDELLTRATLDGFFRWLRGKYFTQEVNSDIRYREQSSISPEEDKGKENSDTI
jgi:hypothetical protein